MNTDSGEERYKSTAAIRLGLISSGETSDMQRFASSR